jgi:hypothetical protein
MLEGGSVETRMSNGKTTCEHERRKQEALIQSCKKN